MGFILLIAGGAVCGVFECLGVLAQMGIVHSGLRNFGLVLLLIHLALTARIIWAFVRPRHHDYILFFGWLFVTVPALVSALITLFVSGFSVQVSFS